jgi:hypothetical protein
MGRSCDFLSPARVWGQVDPPSIGFRAADFGTGAIHWFCDRFFRAESPVIGALLIRPFREHHLDPDAKSQMWAHARQAPAVVCWLQRKGVILSPERHARHHRGGFDRSYCMTSGLLNPLLDRSDFFGNLERAIRSLQRVPR